MEKSIDQIASQIDKSCLVTAEMKLNNLDSITITDMLSLIKTRYTRVLNGMKDRRTHLEKMLEKHNDTQKKIDQTLELMKRVEEEMKELNQPIGRNVEDVYERSAAYQVCT